MIHNDLLKDYLYTELNESVEDKRFNNIEVVNGKLRFIQIPFSGESILREINLYYILDFMWQNSAKKE